PLIVLSAMIRCRKCGCRRPGSRRCGAAIPAGDAGPRSTSGARLFLSRNGRLMKTSERITMFNRLLSAGGGLTRRALLCRAGLGFAALGLGSLMGEAGLLAAEPVIDPRRPLAPRQPQFAAKAKRVIHLFMNGGPSHLDTFDPKPALAKYAGQPLP